MTQHGHIPSVTKEEAFGSDTAAELNITSHHLAANFSAFGVDDFDGLFAAGPTCHNWELYMNIGVHGLVCRSTMTISMTALEQTLYIL